MGRLRKLIPRFSLRTLAVFLLLVTSAGWLWWHWEPWYICWTTAFPGIAVESIVVNHDGGTVEAFGPCVQPEGSATAPSTMWCATYRISDGDCLNRENRDGKQAGEYLWQLTQREKGIPTDETYVASPDGEREFGVSGAGRIGGPVMLTLSVEDAASRRLLARVPLGLLKNGGPMPTVFADDGRSAILGWGTEVVCVRRRRPEWWWGVFWLWEFWLTVVFAGLFVWSVVRDRRALRKQAVG